MTFLDDDQVNQQDYTKRRETSVNKYKESLYHEYEEEMRRKQQNTQRIGSKD